jgi:hypothetical protein
MKAQAIHPSGLMYPRLPLRLEPLGLDTIAVVVCVAGHDVRLLDPPVESHGIASQSGITDSKMAT